MTHQPMDHGPGHRPREHAPGHLPRFHGTSEEAVWQPRTARRRWKLVAVIAIVIAVFLAILITHMTGAMPKTGM